MEKNSEGHDICIITGMCVKMLSFSNEEFVDTACVLGSGEGGNGSAAAGVMAGSYDNGDDDSNSTECVTTGYTAGSNKRAVPSSSNVLSRSSKTGSLPHACDDKKTVTSSRSPTPSDSKMMMHPLRSSRGCGSSSSNSSSICSVNKKNRYRSWVYHSVMHRQQQQHQRTQGAVNLPKSNLAQGAGASQAGVSQLYVHPAAAAHVPTEGSLPVPQLLPPPAKSLQQDSGRVGELIQSYVEDVLCSPKWQQSMDTEDQKMRAKKRSLTLKAFKMMLRGHEPCLFSSSSALVHGRDAANFARICIPEAAALVASMMGNFRRPCADAPVEERRAISEWCSETIHRHICLVNSMCQGVVTDAKIKTTTIGLLYMMRQVSYLCFLGFGSCSESISNVC